MQGFPEFKYILCSYLSRYESGESVPQNNLNTSYVLIYLLLLHR